MNTQENNKLIAEFMGWERRYENTFIDLEGKFVRVSSMCFDISWNELMPVVDKISNLYENGVYFENGEIYTCTIFADISTVYKAVVEFILWYNENK